MPGSSDTSTRGVSTTRWPSATCSARTCATPSIPFDEAVVGRNAVIEAWLDDPDDPDSWQADYDVLAIDGDVFVAHGRTRYLTDDKRSVEREFANVFVCRFDEDGRCREFTEYYMRRRPEAEADEPPAAG